MNWDTGTRMGFAVGGALAGVIGGWDAMFQTLIGFLLLDIVTGYAHAYMTGTVSSKVGWRGGVRKAGELVVIAVAVQLDSMIPASGNMIRSGAILYYIAVEGTSVLENVRALGIPVPGMVTRAMDQVTKEHDADSKPAAGNAAPHE